jgi:DNA-binding transcriptional regulator YdaS (Cro superfamily)
MKDLTPLETAIGIVGSQANLARALGVTPAYVCKMLRENYVPLEQCRPIERVTTGAVTAEQLRPDFFKAA